MKLELLQLVHDEDEERLVELDFNKRLEMNIKDPVRKVLKNDKVFPFIVDLNDIQDFTKHENTLYGSQVEVVHIRLKDNFFIYDTLVKYEDFKKIYSHFEKKKIMTAKEYLETHNL